MTIYERSVHHVNIVPPGASITAGGYFYFIHALILSLTDFSRRLISVLHFRYGRKCMKLSAISLFPIFVNQINNQILNQSAVIGHNLN